GPWWYRSPGMLAGQRVPAAEPAGREGTTPLQDRALGRPVAGARVVALLRQFELQRVAQLQRVDGIADAAAIGRRRQRVQRSQQRMCVRKGDVQVAFLVVPQGRAERI